jgi:hypothetical protein
MLFQIGRLLFPELINRPRAMRSRMLTLLVGLGLILMIGVAGVTVKVSRGSGAPPISTKAVKPPR